MENNYSNFENLPFDVLEIIMGYLPYNDFNSFRNVCTTFQQATRNTKKKQVDISENYYLNQKFLLNEILSSKCTSINLNHCFWLRPKTIRQIIAKTKLKEIHLVECLVNNRVIRDLLGLNLTALSISWTRDRFQYAFGNEKRIKKGFASLKKLELFCPFKMEFDSSWVLLRNCNNLEELKIYSRIAVKKVILPCNSDSDEEDDERVDLYPDNEPTALPKLKKLALDMPAIPDKFLKAILRDKVIPIEEFYIGKQTIKLLTLQHYITEFPTFSLANPSTFCLSAEKLWANFATGAKQCFWEAQEAVQTMLKRKNYQKFEMENLQFDDLLPMAINIVTNSKDSVKEINFNGSIVRNNMLKGIEVIAENCRNLSFLDISFQIWNENNETVLHALSSLTNLQRLHLPPSALSVAQCATATPPIYSFSKVTKGCPKLREIRIVSKKSIGNLRSDSSEKSIVINQNTIADIMYCENLEELHLIDFRIAGPEQALPMIAKRCTKLKVLYINNIQQFHKVHYFEETIKYANSLKFLSFQMNLQLTVPFVNALGKCAKLEKVYINQLTDTCTEANVYVHLANDLPNLKKLCFFYMRSLSNAADKAILESSLRRIADAKPSFFYRLKNSQSRLSQFQQEYPTPVSHLHMRQYEMYKGFDALH